uniref:Uncharacterized protein n=1 Tax=Romanomermis culicivorax TaxID=13658 RepID=A0A915JNT0_ROMCU
MPNFTTSKPLSINCGSISCGRPLSAGINSVRPTATELQTKFRASRSVTGISSISAAIRWRVSTVNASGYHKANLDDKGQKQTSMCQTNRQRFNHVETAHIKNKFVLGPCRLAVVVWYELGLLSL